MGCSPYASIKAWPALLASFSPQFQVDAAKPLATERFGGAHRAPVSQFDAADIKRQRKTADASFDDRSLGPPHLHQAPQHGLAFVYQVEAHMRLH